MIHAAPPAGLERVAGHRLVCGRDRLDAIVPTLVGDPNDLEAVAGVEPPGVPRA
jgi:hypothetical protein